MTTSTGETSKEGEEQGSPPAGESQGKPDDESVPKTQFLAALSNAERKTDEANRRAAAAEAKAQQMEAQLAAKAQQKPPTRAELLKFVDEGQLTQHEADTIWEKQIEDRAAARAVAQTQAATSAQATEQQAKTELTGYREIVPAVWDQGSEDHEKVAKAFQRLVSLGANQRSLATEAEALRNVYGDLETLRASKKSRPGPAESHAETGGSKPSGEGSSNEGVPKGLTAREKEHYEKGITQGRYKDWASVNEELKYANSAVRRRMGAKG